MYIGQYFTKGQYDVQNDVQNAESFKGVTSDMAHGQTYNIDVRESVSGLT